MQGPSAQGQGWWSSAYSFGQVRQHGSLQDLIWDVPDILHELSKLFALKAGDLVFMGTPAGVGPLQAGDNFVATLEGVAELRGRIVTAA